MRRLPMIVTLLLVFTAISAISFGQQPGPYAAPPQDPAQAEPPDQPGEPVARLGVINGDASVRRGDSGDWVAAALNAPLLAGDSVSVGPGGSVELQLDYADFVRIGGDSEVRISQLDNGRNQIQIARGLVTWRVLRDSNTQSEISTPAVAVRPLRLSEVRVEVASDGGTRIIVRRGDADVSTSRGTERVQDGNMMLVRGGPGDPEYQIVAAGPRDSWDNWNEQRDSYLERAQSNRYVSQDIDGAEDLDQYGRWGYDPAYGNVWTPTVPANWAPYQNGQWVWEDYYGWTWVDYDPWGWAPFHYGSWYFRTGYGWSWFPGPRYGHYWWHPAMVGFFGFGGGVGVEFGFGNIGWVPLAPFEVFHPWVGRGWYGGGRFGVFNNVRNINVINVYRNARFANGVSAISVRDFQRGAFRNRIPVGRTQLQQASLVRGTVPVAPTASNLRFRDRGASSATIPRRELGNQRFFSRMSPGPAVQRTPFAQQQAAARTAFAGAARGTPAIRGEAARPQPSSGWRRFGEPSQPLGGQAFGNAQRSPESAPNRGSRPDAGWNRFGSPEGQRFGAPSPGQSGRQGYNYQGGARYEAPRSQPRSLQVSPPMIQRRQESSGGGNFRSTPQSRPGGGSFRSMPQGRPSGGGGSFRSMPQSRPSGGFHGGSHGGGGGRPSGGGGHGGRR